MDVSKFLSKVIGLYLIMISLAMLCNMQQFINNVNGLINNVPLMFVIGFFTLILGILTVVSHNIWVWNWRVLITILAWLTLIKGASIIFYPQVIDNATSLFIQHHAISYLSAIFDFLLGILLCYFGYRKSNP